MGRHSVFKKSLVISTRFEESEYRLIQEIAALESSYTGQIVTAGDLIRNACNFCYRDGERLREVFRRSREHFVKKVPKPY
jgi:hypothetical protein